MNQKNEIKLQKVDHFLWLIPLLNIVYPIIIFSWVLFEWFDFENLIPNFTCLYIGGFLILSSALWIKKLWPKWISSSFLWGFLIGLAETILFLVIAWSFLSIAQFTGTPQVLWQVSLGFIWIVFVKISSDFHYFPQVYRKILTKYYQWFEVTTKE